MSSALLVGFAAGLSLTSPELHDPTAHFKIGTGLDLLFETGPVAALRVEANHEVDLFASLGLGYFGAGLRENIGVPLGISLGPAMSRHHEGELAFGGRALLSYGLYFARVAIEVDATILEGPVYSAGIALRFVPWAPQAALP